MGHRRKSFPNRGSLSIRPRVRAKRFSARWRSFGAPWVDGSAEPVLSGFPAYKVGMTHVIKIEEKLRNKRYKQEVSTAVTVIEIPKTFLFGIRVYKSAYKGTLQASTEVWAHDMNKDFARKLKEPADSYTAETVQEKVTKIKATFDEVLEVRALLYTVPRESGLPKKKPDILEVKISGKDLQKNFDWAVEQLGKEINFLDHFKSDEYVDLTAVTKGKGWSGPVKRHGIKIMPRKKRKGRRVVGSIGAWHPARVSWTTPRAGGLGGHNRTEYNKKIIKVGENPRDINPNAGWKHYGIVKGNYALIQGSVPGASKRLIRLRKTIRKTPKQFPQADPVKIQYISLNFGQKERTEEATK
jgi:large subunit ribosomal protein L3